MSKYFTSGFDQYLKKSANWYNPATWPSHLMRGLGNMLEFGSNAIGLTDTYNPNTAPGIADIFFQSGREKWKNNLMDSAISKFAPYYAASVASPWLANIMMPAQANVKLPSMPNLNNSGINSANFGKVMPGNNQMMMNRNIPNLPNPANMSGQIQTGQRFTPDRIPGF